MITVCITTIFFHFFIFIISKNTTYSNIRKKFPINKNGKRIRDPVKGNNNDYKRPISSIEDQHIDNYIRDRDFQNNNLEQVINRNKVSI